MNPSFHFFLFFDEMSLAANPMVYSTVFIVLGVHSVRDVINTEMVTRGILHRRSFIHTYVHNGETLKFGQSTILCFEAEKMFLIRLRFIAGT